MTGLDFLIMPSDYNFPVETPSDEYRARRSYPLASPSYMAPAANHQPPSRASITIIMSPASTSQSHRLRELDRKRPIGRFGSEAHRVRRAVLLVVDLIAFAVT
jgi:hypothetical protein